MKILVIQLTRLGDILCTLPTLSSLRRDFPEAQIHFLVRKSFAEAASLGSVVDHHWYLDSEKFLTPLVTGDGNLGSSLNLLTQLVNRLRLERFDKIINLSFSPSSSYLTHLVSRGQTKVSGYTRTSDFYLHIPDEASRYFKAQVGLRKSNRIHVIDLMAWVAATTLTENDISILAGDESGRAKSGIVCHLGSSDSRKTWPIEYWMNLVRSLNHGGHHVTLVGGKREMTLGQAVMSELATASGSELLTNKVGLMGLQELVQLVNRSELFIGADSGPLHVASLAGCRALNLSVGDVRFWETGPISSGSRVLVKANPRYLTPETVLDEAQDMLKVPGTFFGNMSGNRSVKAYPLRDSVRYVTGELSDFPDDQWNFVKWLYFRGAKPIPNSILETALNQCIETCEIALQQAEVFYKNPSRVEVSNILDRLDQVLELLKLKVPQLAPIVDDYFCEKANIPPGSREEVFCQTEVCYRNLTVLCRSLLTKSPTIEKGLSP